MFGPTIEVWELSVTSGVVSFIAFWFGAVMSAKS